MHGESTSMMSLSKLEQEMNIIIDLEKSRDAITEEETEIKSKISGKEFRDKDSDCFRRSRQVRNSFNALIFQI